MPLERCSGKAAQANDARVRTPAMLKNPEGEKLCFDPYLILPFQ